VSQACSIKRAVSAPNIAICGAGISGLTLASVLSRELGSRIDITVFERASADRDQGYGLDLDEHGQEALVRAGCYHRYWEMSRKRSDIAAMFNVSAHGPAAEPFAIVYRPKWMMKRWPRHFAAQPESNREKLRDILLDSMASRQNTTVHFEKGAWDIRESESGTAELLDREGTTMGKYSLVVDAMGLHSTLRNKRVIDEDGINYGGMVMVHGIVNPERDFPTDLMRRFAPYGTMGVLGRGFLFNLQRFGAGDGDDRTSLMYFRGSVEGEDHIYEQIGIEKPTSRKGGIMSDARLKRVKEWLKRDMEGAFDSLYLPAVDALERVTVRGVYNHGQATTLRPADQMRLPLVCIGDSALNCGLGGGGNIAMQDAVQLSQLLRKPDAFDSEGRANLRPLREAEAMMMERKVEHWKEKDMWTKHLKSPRPIHGSLDLEWSDFFPAAWKRLAAQIVLPRVGALVKRWYAQDVARGEAGSDEDTPIYSNVQCTLEQQQT